VPKYLRNLCVREEKNENPAKIAYDESRKNCNIFFYFVIFKQCVKSAQKKNNFWDVLNEFKQQVVIAISCRRRKWLWWCSQRDRNAFSVTNFCWYALKELIHIYLGPLLFPRNMWHALDFVNKTNALYSLILFVTSHGKLYKKKQNVNVKYFKCMQQVNVVIWR